MEFIKLFTLKYGIYLKLHSHIYKIPSNSICYPYNIIPVVTKNSPENILNPLQIINYKTASTINAPKDACVTVEDFVRLFQTGNLCRDLLVYTNTTLYLLLSDLEEVSGCRVCININLHKQLYIAQDCFYVFSFIYRTYLGFCTELDINLAVFLKFFIIAVESEDVELLVTAIDGLFPFYSFAKFPAIMAMLQSIVSMFWPYFCEKYGIVGFRCSLTGKIGRRLLTRANTLRFTFGVTSGGTASVRLIFKQHQVQSRTGAFGLVVGAYYK